MTGKRILLALVAMVVISGCSASRENNLSHGESYLRENSYEQALDAFNKAIMEDESLQLAYRGAGIASLKLERYDKAEEYFTRSLRESNGIIGETELDLSYYLAYAQEKSGNYNGAVETYNNILEYDKKESKAADNIEKVEKLQRKIEWFSKIIDYEQTGDFASARTEVEGYLKEYPNDEAALHEYEFLQTR